ncbi:MAG TPA: GNAT family N-acetyltransferase [Candidatus Limnocylindria bacterium]|nr:GNAT family N-acetyltransferase [Candidatus Limnocylindria bacterium]
MAEPARDRKLTIRPLSASRVEDVKTVTRGTWGAQCWDLFPRFTVAQQRALGIAGKQTREVEARRKAILAKLARRRRSSAGLVAYKDGEPIGWISLGPRFDFARIDASRATPPVDDVAVWVVPCITVRRGHRGSGVAVAMIRAAVEYAAKRGAPAVEAYPRAGAKRVHDDFAFFGTEAMFRKAGFRRVRGVLPRLPRGWTPRVTMRATAARPRRMRRGTT